jgi:hypothetical protein
MKVGGVIGRGTASLTTLNYSPLLPHIGVYKSIHNYHGMGQVERLFLFT